MAYYNKLFCKSSPLADKKQTGIYIKNLSNGVFIQIF